MFYKFVEEISKFINLKLDKCSKFTKIILKFIMILIVVYIFIVLIIFY